MTETPNSRTVSKLPRVIAGFHGLLGALFLLVLLLLWFSLPPGTGGDRKAIFVLSALALGHVVVTVGLWRQQRWGTWAAIVLDLCLAAMLGFSAHFSKSILTQTSALDHTILNLFVGASIFYVCLAILAGVAWFRA